MAGWFAFVLGVGGLGVILWFLRSRRDVDMFGGSVCALGIALASATLGSLAFQRFTTRAPDAILWLLASIAALAIAILVGVAWWKWRKRHPIDPNARIGRPSSD